MPNRIFGFIFLGGLVATTAIRLPYGRRHRRPRVAQRRGEPVVVSLLMALWGLAQIAAVLRVLTPWLTFADYRMPTWTGVVGAAVYVAGLWLLWRSHTDLGRHWSPTLEIKDGHALATDGVYGLIRHPMYAAHWLWVIAQPLLLQNWIAGPPALAVFLPLYLLRVPREERMLLDHFGNAYRSYMNRTGRLIPRLRR